MDEVQVINGPHAGEWHASSSLNLYLPNCKTNIEWVSSDAEYRQPEDQKYTKYKYVEFHMCTRREKHIKSGWIVEGSFPLGDLVVLIEAANQHAKKDMHRLCQSSESAAEYAADQFVNFIKRRQYKEALEALKAFLQYSVKRDSGIETDTLLPLLKIVKIISKVLRRSGA